ncbi:hypothetical protein SAMN05428962_5916 [Paenibacillus sp. BC26]|nr:hypothetical protein SAMN05428962_5916 [Paenibacillus sp. BC26]
MAASLFLYSLYFLLVPYKFLSFFDSQGGFRDWGANSSINSCCVYLVPICHLYQSELENKMGLVRITNETT